MPIVAFCPIREEVKLLFQVVERPHAAYCTPPTVVFTLHYTSEVNEER